MERSILEWSFRALLMVVGTGVVVSALRVRAASVLHRAWSAAMVAMLLLPVWTSWGPSVTARVLPAAPEVARFGEPAREVPVSADLPQTAVSQAVPPAAPIEPDRSAPRSPGPDWHTILLAIYLAGFAAMLSRLLAGTVKIRSMARHARESGGFVTSPRCAAPITIGWLRPILLLPDCWRTWPAGKLEAVLIHEREHIRRRDPLVQWLALLNRCVFWFHPLAWWLERKLAALAEEACDAAVLTGGHAPYDYARYLIEIARSVNETGARVRWAGAVAFSAGKLPRRIRRIMDGAPASTTSRAKSIASASLCTLILATLLACNLGRPSGRAAGQPTMAQQEQRERARMLEEQQQWQRRGENAALWNAVLSASPNGAKVLLDHVEAHPGDQDNLQQLVSYYQSRKDLKSLDALTLWYIGQHPDMRVNWGNRPLWDTVWDKDGYERGRELWTAKLKQTWDSPYIYMNAAEFLAGSDNEQAEQILQEGRRKFPPTGQYSGLHWEMLLAHLYAWALAGPEGPMTDKDWGFRNEDSKGVPNQSPYAQKVRTALLASNDFELLDRTVERLQGNRPNMAFAQSLNARVLSIHPDDREANMQRDGFQLSALELRTQTDPGSLNDADRMALLQSQLMPQRRDADGTEAKARELLTLASRNTKNPDYGTSVFLANMALGKAAFARGDKQEALRLLLAASEAPPTEHLRHYQIDMSLPAKLVDAGEREAVAKFLDRCAKFDTSNKRLPEWAGQIRQGINPALRPNSDLFRRPG